MNRKYNQLATLIQTARGNNYVAHYDTRAIVKTMPADLIAEFADVAAFSVPFPVLNIFGATFEGWMPASVDKLLRKLWTPSLIHIFNPWYLSEEGWEGFQVLWKALPEPEEMNLDESVLLSQIKNGVAKIEQPICISSGNNRQIKNMVHRLQTQTTMAGAGRSL